MHTQTVRNMVANEGGRGNLAGFEVSCTCGYKEGTTMQSSVQMMVFGHNQYHQKYDAEKAKKASRAKAVATRKRNNDPFGFKKAGILK